MGIFGSDLDDIGSNAQWTVPWTTTLDQYDIKTDKIISILEKIDERLKELIEIINNHIHNERGGL